MTYSFYVVNINSIFFMGHETELNVSIFEKFTKITKRMAYINSFKFENNWFKPVWYGFSF